MSILLTFKPTWQPDQCALTSAKIRQGNLITETMQPTLRTSCSTEVCSAVVLRGPAGVDRPALHSLKQLSTTWALLSKLIRPDLQLKD